MGICVFIGYLSFFWAVTVAYIGVVAIFVESSKLRRTAFIALAVLLTASSVLISWPFGYLLPMSGVVRDKKTGEPIANAIFEIEWIHHYASAGGASGRTFDKTYVVSGKDGKYRIGGRLMFPFPIGSNRVYQSFTLRYPLYKSFRCSGDDCAEYPVLYTDEDPWKYVNSKYYVWRKPNFRPRFGRTKRDFELLSLEDIYKTVDNRKKSCDADNDLVETFMYAELAMQLKLSRSIAWEGILERWNSFIAKWPQSDVKETALKGLARTKEKLLGANTPAK